MQLYLFWKLERLCNTFQLFLIFLLKCFTLLFIFIIDVELPEKMESNADSEVTNLHGDITEASETTVEIKVKTLDSKIYTLHVNKCVSISYFFISHIWSI